MKSKKKIAKIIGAAIGIGAICCIIPACVVSCGSSSSSSQSPSTTSNGSGTESSPSSTGSKINNIPNTPISASSGLVSTSISNDTSSASKDTWSSTGLSAVTSIPKKYLPILENSLSIWTLNSQSTRYLISCNTPAAIITYQWYQIPFSVFMAQLNNFTNDVNNYNNATLFAQLLCQSGKAIVGATSSTYNFAYGTSLNDALYVCEMKENNDISYSQITWLRSNNANNPLDIATYSLNYYDTADLENPSNDEDNINPVQGNNGIILETYNGTQITFTLSLNNGNIASISSIPYFVVFNAGNVYSPVMNLQNSKSWAYIFTASAQTTNVGVSIFGPNGELISTINNGTFYTISVNDPLDVADATFNVNSSAPSKEITNSQGTTINEITATQGQSITFTLNITGFTASDFLNSGYTIQWLNNNNNVDAPMQNLSNQSAWSYTIKAPNGTTTIGYAIYGVNGEQVSPSNSNNAYQINVSYITISANASQTQYGTTNIISIQSSLCSWLKIKYEWQSSINGKDWTTITSGNLTDSNQYLVNYVPSYNVPKTDNALQYRLVIINANDSSQSLISNVVTVSDNLVTSSFTFNNSTNQAEFKKGGLAFEYPNHDFDVSISLTQFGDKIKNINQLQGISLTLSATYLPSYEYGDFTTTLTTIDNIASKYDIASNSIVIPINASSLFKWTQQMLTEYNNDPNGNYELSGWYPVTLNCSLTQNGYSISNSSLKFSFEQITITAPAKDNTGMEVINNVYFLSNNQVQMTANTTNIYSFLSQTKMYFQWQVSSNGTSDWQDISGQTTDSFNDYLNEPGYYRLVIYQSPKKEFFIASNIIHFEFMS